MGKVKIYDDVHAEQLLRRAAAICRNAADRLDDAAQPDECDLRAEALRNAAGIIQNVAQWLLDKTDKKEGD